MAKKEYLEIGDYGIIGDTLTASLVGRDGSVDWLCLPRFDSPSVFAALLDSQRGGNFRIRTEAAEMGSQKYEGFTNVLVTTMKSGQGVLELTDFMPIRKKPGKDQELHRVARCVGGKVKLNVHCSPRPDYARKPVKAEKSKGGFTFGSPPEQFILLTSADLSLSDGEVNGTLELSEGEAEHFVFRELKGDLAEDVSSHCEKEMKATRDYWKKWSDRCAYKGRWMADVKRSALVLKLLTYSPTGAIVAAPTASLPEEIGGERNWDYRYSWLRDASLTLEALLSLGYQDEFKEFMGWIARNCMQCGEELQVVFGIKGERTLTESILDHLEGYRNSRPVRIGNEAYDQFQLDIYGEAVNASYTYLEQGGTLDEEMLELIKDVTDYVVANWRRPDKGIWEVRGGDLQFLYSKLMCWVALDRGLKIAEKVGLDIDRKSWEKTISEIEEEIMTRGWSESKGSLTMNYGTEGLDASLLNYPLLGFFQPDDPRVSSMVNAIESELGEGNLVKRYTLPDGLRGSEGAFLLCSCWLADCHTLLGNRERSEEIIDFLCHVTSPLGLLSEEVDMETTELLGNYPQAFSHIGLINSVLKFRAHFPEIEAG